MSQLNDSLKSFDLAELDKMLNSIANEDALKIIIASKMKIGNSARVIKELGLTQRKYHAASKDLLKLARYIFWSGNFHLSRRSTCRNNS